MQYTLHYLIGIFWILNYKISNCPIQIFFYTHGIKDMFVEQTLKKKLTRMKLISK